ncbi:MAG: 50S ribosomal protein L13 [Fibromonadaceae bacterium]|jgi:large subunit ribosomal protein L13|nr:50S ribosomal protein L13 [Fibromonadaceae bacterium]
MKTPVVNPNAVERKWKIIDAEGKPLGRVASKIAHLLMGKHKALYAPNIDVGDYVVVINAAKVALTGKKAETKQYFHHTGNIGGERWISFKQYLNHRPEYPLEHAVWGMLPHKALGHKMFKKLKVYAGAEHKETDKKLEPVAI